MRFEKFTFPNCAILSQTHDIHAKLRSVVIFELVCTHFS